MEQENGMIDYSAVLADLEAKRNALDAAIAGVKQMLGQASASQPSGIQFSSSNGSTALRGDEFFQMNIADAAIKYLGMIKKPQSTQDLATALEKGGMTHTSQNFYQTVAGSLARRAESDEKLVRVKRGMWGLGAWYPGRKFKKGENNEGKTGQQTELMNNQA